MKVGTTVEVLVGAKFKRGTVCGFEGEFLLVSTVYGCTLLCDASLVKEVL